MGFLDLAGLPLRCLIWSMGARRSPSVSLAILHLACGDTCWGMPGAAAHARTFVTRACAECLALEGRDRSARSRASAMMTSVRLHRPTANLAGNLLAHVVACYIMTSRDRLAPKAAALSESSVRVLEPYFGKGLLAETRVVMADPLPIPAVPFQRLLWRIGLPIPSAETIAAITLFDLIAVRETPSPRLIFHELVHVVQFRQGTDRINAQICRLQALLD